MDAPEAPISAGSVFISRHDDVLIVVEGVDADRAIFRYVVTNSSQHLGKVDWAYISALKDGRWERLA